MIYIELKVFALFQKFAHGVQDFFGYDNFSLARLSLIIRSVGMIISVPVLLLSSKSGFGGGDVMVTLLLTLANLAICWYLFQTINKVEEVVTKRSEFKNPLEVAAWFLRLFFWVLVILSTKSLLHAYDRYVIATEWWAYWGYMYYAIALADSCMFLCFAYFISCTPKPRKKSTIKKLAEKLASVVSPQPAAAHAVVTRN